MLFGRVRLRAGDSVWDGVTGDLLIVPEAGHALDVLEDSAILLATTNRRRAAADPAQVESRGA